MPHPAHRVVQELFELRKKVKTRQEVHTTPVRWIVRALRALARPANPSSLPALCRARSSRTCSPTRSTALLS